MRARRLVYNEWILLLIVTALAAVLRLYALDRLPAGLYHDEAYNGLDALHVLQGEHPIFFEANNGREPLFIYLVALSVALLGRSPFAIRLVAALLGTLTVPAAYLMAREFLGRRVAILTAIITALTFWHLNLSRLGLRAISLPLLAALCLWLFARGLHNGRRREFALAGLFLGVSVYSYIAARFLPLALLAMGICWVWRRKRLPWRGLFLLFGVALVAALPLLVYFGQHWSTFLERAGQVSILNPTINQGDLLGTLVRHLLKVLGMFNWKGDFIPRHNLPLRPVFDPLMGLFFLLGCAVSLWRARNRPEYAMFLAFLAVMLLPTVLAEDAPHFLRGVGILPVVFVFPAIGLAAAWDGLQKRVSRPVVLLVILGVVAWSGAVTVRDYFPRHVRSEAVYYNFEAGAVELAAQVNSFLGTGWRPDAGLRTTTAAPNPRRQIYLEERLWRDWTSLRYLVPQTSGLVLLEESTPAGSAVADEVWLVVWPFADQGPYLDLLPREHAISVQEGPLERGDLEKEARLLCLIYQATPADTVPTNLRVSFENGIELLGYDLQPGPQETRLRLFWRAGEALDTDYSVFVHLARVDQPVDQSDSYPANGYYPTRVWRPGDVVVDEHVLKAPVSQGDGYTLSIGLYQWQTMARLQVLDSTGNPTTDHITITVL